MSLISDKLSFLRHLSSSAMLDRLAPPRFPATSARFSPGVLATPRVISSTKKIRPPTRIRPEGETEENMRYSCKEGGLPARDTLSFIPHLAGRRGLAEKLGQSAGCSRTASSAPQQIYWTVPSCPPPRSLKAHACWRPLPEESRT